MSTPNDHTSTELPEPEPSVPLLQEMQEPSSSLRGGIDARDIRAKNVVSGSQTIIEQQTIYQGSQPSAPRQTPLFMAADLPADFVARPREFEALKRSLLQGQLQGVTAITSTLIGAGGYGKTTLALALCHDTDVRERFHDGILWVTLGDQPTHLISKIDELVYLLTREHLGVSSLEAAITVLKEALADHSCLLVIDDVWRASDLMPFLQGASHCARLVTTRNEHVLPRTATHIPVDAMSQDEAIYLLQTGIETVVANEQDHVAFRQLAARLGEWPLLLTLANGVLRERVLRFHEPLSAALTALNRALEKRGVAAFDARNASRREEAVTRTLEVSIQQLDAGERERFAELAIFPEDVNIPLVTVSQLWKATATFDVFETEDLCRRLASLSLLLSCDLSQRSIRLHDIVRRYLHTKIAPRLVPLNQQFLDSYTLSRWADLPRDEPYLWAHLTEHLIMAGRGEELAATVKDLHYMTVKTRVRGVPTLEQDIHEAMLHVPDDATLQLLSQHIALIAHVLPHGKTTHEVEGIVLHHFCQVTGLETLCELWTRATQRPQLLPWYPIPEQRHPALIRTLAAHTGRVNGCAISADGLTIVSASFDHTLKVWDALSGQKRLTLSGHTDWVRGCAISADGRTIISASDDNTLKVWDALSGQARLTLHTYTHKVNGCAISADGRTIVSASWDGTLEVWDALSGQARPTFHTYTRSINGCAISADGRTIVSASAHGILEVWDALSRQKRLTLSGHTAEVRGCAISADGRIIVSASWDGTLKVWDALSGQARLTLSGHTDRVNGCAVSADGRTIVSASDDKTLKVWDALSGQARLTLSGHINWVKGCAISADGRTIVSASADNTLKVWNALSRQKRLTLSGHTTEVRGCAVSADGRTIVSASSDHTLKVWDALSGQARLTLFGDGAWVNGCAISADGRTIVSASWDGTLKVWDALSGQKRFTLSGHTTEVRGCAISADGRTIVSASADKTLKVWDALSGQKRLTLSGHIDWVNGCAVSADGRTIVSASADKTLKVWDAQSGRCITTFYSEGYLSDCAIHPDGEHLVAAGESGFFFLRILW